MEDEKPSSHWMLWVERLPRPERNGLKGVVMMMAFMWFVVAPISGGGPIDAVICEVMPWKCLGRGLAQSDAACERRKRYHAMPLIDPLARGTGPKICSCHLDLHFAGKPVRHLREIADQQCDSDYVSPREWTEARNPPGCGEHNNWSCTALYVLIRSSRAGSVEIIEMKDGEGEYRYHCEE